ncbi:MAG: FHA domain-containing protein [Planctomycetaceae bacterium]
MPEIILRSGKRAGRRITLPAGEVVIGRDEGCRIRLTSSDVSRRHCLLRSRGEDVVASDLGSRNGTFVNESPIAGPTLLRPGDLLRVGPFLFQVPGSAERRMSDEEISGWLTVEGNVAGAPPAGVKNETTLMDEVDDEKGPQSPPETTLAPALMPDAKDPIVTQAVDVIREYWAGKKGRR